MLCMGLCLINNNVTNMILLWCSKSKVYTATTIIFRTKFFFETFGFMFRLVVFSVINVNCLLVCMYSVYIKF